LKYQTSSRCAFDWEYPGIDIQVFNPSPATIFITEAVFNISSAKLVYRPLLTIRKDTFATFAGELRLVNESWKPITNVKLRFNILPGFHDQYSTAAIFAHEINIESIEDEVAMDISGLFVNEGVDLQTICELEGDWTSEDRFEAKMPDKTTRGFTRDEFTAFWDGLYGRFTEKVASLMGILTMDRDEALGHMETAFIAHVNLENKNRRGLPRPSSADYHARFRFSELPYKEMVHLSQELKPQEADRFTIRLAIPGTGRFDFDLLVKDVGGNIVYSSRIVLDGFVPHSLADRLSA
jgi:hypothetical protein